MFRQRGHQQEEAMLLLFVVLCHHRWSPRRLRLLAAGWVGAKAPLLRVIAQKPKTGIAQNPHMGFMLDDSELGRWVLRSVLLRGA